MFLVILIVVVAVNAEFPGSWCNADQIELSQFVFLFLAMMVVTPLMLMMVMLMLMMVVTPLMLGRKPGRLGGQRLWGFTTTDVAPHYKTD